MLPTIKAFSTPHPYGQGAIYVYADDLVLYGGVPVQGKNPCAGCYNRLNTTCILHCFKGLRDG